MAFDLLILTFSALGAGLLVFLVPRINTIFFTLSLVFAGSYLFSITIIHLLPELFTAEEDPAHVGLYILLGFFMQIFIAQLTSGIEHGHIHKPANDHGHAHHFSAITLLVALCFHAFMEGALLAHPSEHIHQHETQGLLLGIVFHKMPAAFALMSVLFSRISRARAVCLLLIFSVSSPVGMLVSTQFHDMALIGQETFLIIYALVCGNFLHISTTIFFESSPEHQLHLKRLAVSLAGALFAVLAEFLI